ncbi:MAG TPA: endonuclease [Prolixibacteraceae bacterium]|nr:endonuclease [Prolixibacteraceae bacterium]
MKPGITTVVFFVFSLLGKMADAQPPAGYYDPASGLTGKALQQALHNIIKSHTVVPYSDLYKYFRTTDVKNDSVVWDMYSDRPGGVAAYLYVYGKGQECGNYNSEADCYNREHSFPKSWFGDAAPMESDLFHLYPTDGYVNNRRANYPFGEIKSPAWVSTNGSKVGPCSFPGYSGVVFEPIDAYKGDFARTMLYMAVRYMGEDTGWPGSEMVTGAEPKAWALRMLMEWHRKDSVSSKETSRNNAVYVVQKNRNPFIDHPEFAEKIWEEASGVRIIAKADPNIQVYPNPATDYVQVNLTGFPMEKTIIMVYSITGTLLERAESTSHAVRLSVAHLSRGAYLIKVNCGGQSANSIFCK